MTHHNPKITEKYTLRNLHMNVHSRIIYNRQKVETTQMLISWHIHTMAYYTAIERKKYVTEMNPGNKVKEACDKRLLIKIAFVRNV